MSMRYVNLPISLMVLNHRRDFTFSKKNLGLRMQFKNSDKQRLQKAVSIHCGIQEQCGLIPFHRTAV